MLDSSPAQRPVSAPAAAAFAGHAAVANAALGLRALRPVSNRPHRPNREGVAAALLPLAGLGYGQAASRSQGIEPTWFLQQDVMRVALEHMLNEVDYGMFVVGPQGQLMHMNLAARQQLDESHPLQLGGSTLRARSPQEAGLFTAALEAAERGLRRLITMGRAEQRVSVAVVPLAVAAGGAPATLLMLGRRRVCQQLSVQGFATALAITPAETRVLEALCAGDKPTDIARQNKVKMSTVRAQIHSIRGKCGASSIRELVQQVSMLPPMLSALRANARTGLS